MLTVTEKEGVELEVAKETQSLNWYFIIPSPTRRSLMLRA